MNIIAHALPFIFLACGGHGQRRRPLSEHLENTHSEKSLNRADDIVAKSQSHGPPRNAQDASRALAKFLVSANPAAGYVQPRAGDISSHHSGDISSHHNFRWQVHHVARSNIPVAADHPDASEELSESDIKKLQAEKLQLQAEVAALKAKELELKAGNLETGAPSTPVSTPLVESTPATLPETNTMSMNTLEELCECLEREVVQNGLEPSEKLREIMTKAWEAGRVKQREEIEKLRGQVEQADQDIDTSLDAAKANFDLALKQLAGGSSGGDAKAIEYVLSGTQEGTPEERRGRARNLTRDTFEFFLARNSYNETDENLGAAGKVVFQGDGIISLSAARQRLDWFERHERAQCVEYRMFAMGLSEDDAFAEAIGTELDAPTEYSEGNASNFLFACFKYSADDEMLQFLELEESDRPLARWLGPLADMLGRSASGSFDPQGETTFPLWLSSLAARQGNFEPLVLYYVARLLARFNVKALARYEGRPEPANPDRIVSQEEAGYLLKPLSDIVTSVTTALFVQSIIVFFLAYQVFNFVSGALKGAPADPLNF